MDSPHESADQLSQLDGRHQAASIATDGIILQVSNCRLLVESWQWCKQDQILKTKTKLTRPRPRSPEVNNTRHLTDLTS